MKKILTNILLLLLILLPSTVFACPHYDEDGNIHLQTYNDDYSMINMLYPKDKHLHVKTVNSIDKDYYIIPDYDALQYETFSFAIIQNNETYYTYYWYVNNDLLPEDVDTIENTVKNLEYMNVTSNDFNLKVFFTNTYGEGSKFNNEYTKEIYYDVIIANKIEDTQYTDIIANKNMTLYSEKIVQIDARFNIMEVNGYDYSNEFEEIISLYDEVIIEMDITSTEERLVAVNLDKPITENSFINVTKISDTKYSYSVNEVGTYAIVSIDEDNFIPDEITNVSVDGTSETEFDESGTEIHYIIGIIVAFIITIIVVSIVSKKSKNN